MSATGAQVEAARAAVRYVTELSMSHLQSEAVADAVVAAGADADEVERLRVKAARLREELAIQTAQTERAEAEVERLRAALKREEDAHDGQVTRACEAEATLARVEALADEWRGKRDKAMCSDENDLRFYAYVMSKRIVELGTALSGPEGASDE